jgi:outer membrane protein assembly factor BamA
VIQRLEYRRLGGVLGLGYQTGRFNNIGLDYRIEGIETSFRCNPDEAEAPRLLDLQDVHRGRSYLSSLTFSFEHDTRDAAFMPSSGSRFGVAVELGTELVGSDYTFSKYVLDGETVLPGYGDHALRLRALIGLVQGETPFFNKFFHADTAFFTLRKDSLPRVLELNLSELGDTIRYDPFVFSAGVEYAIPLPWHGSFLYRSEVFAAADYTITRTVDEVVSGADPGRKFPFPLSFDLGMRFDTSIGLFVFSTARIVDLFL